MKQFHRSLLYSLIIFILLGGTIWCVYQFKQPQIVRVSPPATRPNILLITLESIRPDHVTCETEEYCTSPNLTALMKEGVMYENAYSVTSWTLSAHASLFTGLYPLLHQTNTNSSRLGDSYTTIAEILSNEGYQCAGIVSGPFLQRPYNLHQGFEYYNDSPSEQFHWEAHGDVTNPLMSELLADFILNKRDADRPFFLFAYFWDPHYDYIPPAPYDSMFVKQNAEPIDITAYETSSTVNLSITQEQLQYVISQYDGEIRWTDEHVGKLMETLKDQGLWDHTVIIITADHGEEFFEHGDKGHRRSLYEESVHVPLIIKYTDKKSTGKDLRLVSLVDIFPTILDITGITSSAFHQGVSLLTSSPESDRAIFFDLFSLKAKRRFFAIRRDVYKLIHTFEDKSVECYNLRDDPGEKTNIAMEEASETRKIVEELVQWEQQMMRLAKNFQSGGQVELTPENLEQLRSLGYIH